MRKNLSYIMLALLLLTAGAGQSVAQTIDSDLNDKFYTQVGNQVQDAASLTEGQWYCIKALGASSSSNNQYLQGGSTTLAQPTVDARAVDQPAIFFKVEKSGSNFYLKSGNGYYLEINQASQNTTQSQSQYGPPSTTYSYSATMSWPTTKPTTTISYSNYNLIRSNSKKFKEDSDFGKQQQVTVYSYLYATGSTLSAIGSKNTSESSNEYQFYFLPVTFVTKYTVTYNFKYTEDGAEKALTSTELVQKDNNPTYTTADGLNSLLQSKAPSIFANYQVDASNNFPTFSAVTGDVTYTINLKTRETLIDQVLTFNTPVDVFEGETRDLDNFIVTKEDGATITYAITSGGEYLTISDSKITGVAKGSAVVTATSAAFNKFNAVTVEIPITVTGYTDTQKAFIAAYDALDAYKDKIGIRLGQYTYKSGNSSTNDNDLFVDMLFDYLNQRNDVRSYTDRDLEAATTAINALKDDMTANNNAKLSLNLPTPGTLLKMKASGSTSYIAPTPPTGTTYTDILYYYDPSSKTTETKTIGSLVSYDTGYHVQSMAVASSIGAGTDYTFTAMTPSSTDGLYKANELTTSYVLEDVDILPVTISEYGYATLYTPVALDIPNTLKAYIATAQSGTTLTLTRIRGVAPKGTALVLVGPAGTYEFTVNRSTTDEALTSPLKGTYPVITTTSAGSSVYTLQPYTPSGASTYSNVAFYPYSDTENITHFKCYFTVSGNAPAHYDVIFTEDAVTPVEEIEATESSAEDTATASPVIYDLLGRAVGTDAGALPRGIYIIGDRKIMVR